MTEPELWWVAGLLEGEGCFSSICEKPTKRNPNPALCLQIHMGDFDVIKKFAGLVGMGNVTGPQKIRASHHTPMYAWKITGKQLVPLLRKLYPLLGERRQESLRLAFDKCGESL